MKKWQKVFAALGVAVLLTSGAIVSGNTTVRLSGNPHFEFGVGQRRGVASGEVVSGTDGVTVNVNVSRTTAIRLANGQVMTETLWFTGSNFGRYFTTARTGWIHDGGNSSWTVFASPHVGP